MRDERGLTPIVGKVLEIGIVTLYLGLVTATLFGGMVPEYRAATGQEVGERVLATASHEIQRSVPPTASSVRADQPVELPRTIADRAYELRVRNRTLVLEHPDPAIDGSARLALPESVKSVSGRWSSGEPALVEVSGDESGLDVRLRAGEE